MVCSQVPDAKILPFAWRIDVQCMIFPTMKMMVMVFLRAVLRFGSLDLRLVFVMNNIWNNSNSISSRDSVLSVPNVRVYSHVAGFRHAAAILDRDWIPEEFFVARVSTVLKSDCCKRVRGRTGVSDLFQIFRITRTFLIYYGRLWYRI